MKPILFATNYSTASENAGDYAAQLAKLCQAPLVVLHSWTLPVITPEDAILVPPSSEFHIRQREEVNKEVLRLRAKWGIHVTGIEVNGYTPEEIASLTHEHDISLVVLGMHHHNFCSRLIGSVATTALHKAGYPVLLVPDTVRFHKPSKVIMAVDANHETEEHTLDTLKLFVRKLDTQLELVNVESPSELWTVEETPALIRLEHSLRYIEHQWKIEVNEDQTEGIRHAAETSGADWIAVAPRHFTWFENIFKKGITEKLAYSTDRPLLVLPAITEEPKQNKRQPKKTKQ